MKYSFTRGEEVATSYAVDIEADSFEEAKDKYNAMQQSGMFYSEAEMTSESVTDSWDEVEYVDETGNYIHTSL